MIKLLTTIQRDRKQTRAGSTLELDAAEEKRLVDAGDAEIVDPDSATSDAGSTLSPDAQAFAKMGAKDAIEFVGTLPTLAEVFGFSAVESLRKGGPRVTVQEAFTQRVIDLTKAPATT